MNSPPKPRTDARGALVVISGPSGSGKTTICAQIAQKPGVWKSISTTTRRPGPGEVNGRNYHFRSREEFEQGIRDGAFIEHAEYRGNLYGTLRAPLEERLRQGRICLLEIDVQGALQLMPLFPDGVFIFVMPPNEETLRERLAARARDRIEEIEARLAVAKKEMEYRSRYGYGVVNDDLSTAVQEVWDIIQNRVRAGEGVR